MLTKRSDIADINECATNNGGCSADASCTNTAGGVACACLPGYIGDGFTCTGERQPRCTFLIKSNIINSTIICNNYKKIKLLK